MEYQRYRKAIGTRFFNFFPEISLVYHENKLIAKFPQNSKLSLFPWYCCSTWRAEEMANGKINLTQHSIFLSIWFKCDAVFREQKFGLKQVWRLKHKCLTKNMNIFQLIPQSCLRFFCFNLYLHQHQRHKRTKIQFENWLVSEKSTFKIQNTKTFAAQCVWVIESAGSLHKKPATKYQLIVTSRPVFSFVSLSLLLFRVVHKFSAKRKGCNQIELLHVSNACSMNLWWNC
jgi:hypothetical protein